jgi:hypothetical protein
MNLRPPLSLSFVLASSRCNLGRAAGPAAASRRSWWAWYSGNSLRLGKKRRILNGLRRHSLVVLYCSDGVLPALRSNCTSIAATTKQSFCAFSYLYSLAPHKIRVSADGLFGGSPQFHPQISTQFKPNFFSTQIRPQIIQQWTSKHQHARKDEW